jgi:hypothetical protein
MVSTILVIFLLLLLLLILIEYKNEKKYQETRNNKNNKTLEKKNTANENKLKKHKPNIPNTPHVMPHKKYPNFSHERLIKMGLSQNEVLDFVKELIPQIEIQTPLIKEAINLSDFHQVERLTHHIKGSATNIGTGGVADLLIEYNTYLKSGTDIEIIKSYFQSLVYYTKELKRQYTY